MLLNGLVQRKPGISVFYGGARTGDVGGPLVKAKRLQQRFPEARWGYSLVYSLSNAPYLPPAAFKWLKSRGIPIVHNQNGVFYGAWFAGDWQAQNRRMAVAYHAADWVFFQSEFCKLAAEKFLGERRGPGEILYNAVDTERFHPGLSRPEGPFAFLVTGKFDKHIFYRIESTILGMAHAVTQGLDCRLAIAGWMADEARSETENLARKLGMEKRVRISGRYSQQEAPAIYGAADCYVMMKHNDPCPNTVLEALACGLPVVYSNSGGVAELVGSEAGVPVDCGQSWERNLVPDPEAIGTAMIKAASLRKAMGRAARERAVARFAIEHWIARHEQVFQRLLNGEAP